MNHLRLVNERQVVRRAVRNGNIPTRCPERGLHPYSHDSSCNLCTIYVSFCESTNVSISSSYVQPRMYIIDYSVPIKLVP